MQRVFAEFGDLYTLLDVYNNSKKLELAHAHYEANTIRFPSHSFSKAKAMHFATPILLSCNYCGNPAHKANEYNIPFDDLFYDYYGKE